ncbi:MAG: hypothetical protein OXG05_04295 [Gammaproteobacteria bacterium]|nr:hypothetical protein [Gammaproteobacteria bacterium]
MIRTFFATALTLAFLSLGINAQLTEQNGDSEPSLVLEASRGCPMSPYFEVSMPLLDEIDEKLVRDALNLDGTQRFPVCAFRAINNSNERNDWLEQYTPSDEVAADPRDQDQVGWHLVSIEGREPTEKEFEEYEHRGGRLYPYLELYELVDFEHLEVADRSANRVVYETKPTLEFLEKNDAGMLNDHVTTTLVVDPDSRRLDFVTTKLNEGFKPNPFMRVYEFDQSLNYEFIPEVGEVILTSLRMQADVKFVVIRRRFHLNADLSNFSCPVALQPATCEEPAPLDID